MITVFWIAERWSTVARSASGVVFALAFKYTPIPGSRCTLGLRRPEWASKV